MDKVIEQIANLIKHTYDVHNKALPTEWHKIAATRVYKTYIEYGGK